MIKNKFGEIVFSETDLMDQIMQGKDVTNWKEVCVDPRIQPETILSYLEDPGQLMTWTFPENSDISVPEFHARNQANWHMPNEYKELDIAEHVLGLCKTDAELQRVGQELLMFQERDLFDLLRYLKYLVDTMTQNRCIWGVGRGSSVASYVLFLLGVHRVDSVYYDLDIKEFLR